MPGRVGKERASNCSVARRHLCNSKAVVTSLLMGFNNKNHKH